MLYRGRSRLALGAVVMNQKKFLRFGVSAQQVPLELQESDSGFCSTGIKASSCYIEAVQDLPVAPW